jgi:hypothetical protein
LADLIDIDYRPLPMIATIADAAAESATTLHPEMDRQHRCGV